jgi:hypothetical protein
VSERTLSVLDGSTFVVSDRLGDVRADDGREQGFFSEDTRFISRWVLRVGADPLLLLSLDQAAHFDARFFLTPRVGPEDQARRRSCDDGSSTMSGSRRSSSPTTSTRRATRS